MKIQHGRWRRMLRATLAGLVLGGCGVQPAARWARFEELKSSDPASPLRAISTTHFELMTSIADPQRRLELITTLERGYEAYCDTLNYRPPTGAPKMKCFVFATGDQWARFTVQQTGEMASVYLQTRRGGYTVGKLFASRDAGAQDTLTVAAHEGLHLFIATHFVARPPPFLEEGLACCFESVRREDRGITINVGENGARQRRLALAVEENKLQPLRKLLAMHAGQVVGLDILEVETFYAQAWAFARFLIEAETGKYRPAMEKLIADAQAGRLSSDDLPDNPALIERYLGVGLDTIQPQYDRFVVALAKKARLGGSE